MFLLKGIVQDNNDQPIRGASVFLSDSAGKPISNDGLTGTITNDKGEYNLFLPTLNANGILVPVANYITARKTGSPARVKQISKGQTVYNFSFGGVQEEAPVTVIGTKPDEPAGRNFQIKLKPWHWLLIAGAGLIITATIVGIANRKA